jgi:hypothetical protein
LIHERGIEVGKKSISAIDNIKASSHKKELQSLLKLKANQKFVWGEEQQKALDNVKQYLKSPPVLMPPQDKKSFNLYLSAYERAIGSALVQEFEGKERVVYFVSRRILDTETRYSAVERLCLCLYFSCTKLRPYLLNAECTVVCKDDVVKYMLSLPILKGRIGKWILALSEFDLTYQSAKAIKGQVMADLVTKHCRHEIAVVEPIPWTMFFDGSSCGVGVGIGIVLILPQGANYKFFIPIEKTSTNNQADYQAVLKG